LGVFIEGDWLANSIQLLLKGSAYADFAMIKPVASQGMENYLDFFWRSKSALWKNSYVYDLSSTAMAYIYKLDNIISKRFTP
jgi:hypothetical protein